MEEIWKDIDGFENLYQVSNLGRIKSFHKRYKNPRILKTHIRVNGYVFICLHKNKELYTVDVHRLVAKAFVKNENPSEYDVVLHLDDNKENNIYTNLKWGTQKENCNTVSYKNLQSENAKKRIGEKNSFYGKKHTEETKQKISEYRKKKVICNGIIYNSILECASALNTTTSSVGKVLRKGQKTINGKEISIKYYEG